MPLFFGPCATKCRQARLHRASPRLAQGGSVLSTSCVAPRLAAGVELLGPYEGGDADDPRYLYRLADGQAVEVPRLLHLVARRLDGDDVGEIARQVSDEVGRRLSPDNVRFLVDQKLRPLGLVAGESENAARPSPAAGLLALRFRAALVPVGVVRRATALLRPLFLPPVVLTVLAAFLAIDLWLFLGPGVTGGVRQVLHQPVLVPAVWGVVVLAGMFHELGHATACRYGGARPGRIGFGLYLVWPVFYSDVTDSYRLGRRGRLRTDLGGLYFNAVFVVAMAGIYAVAGWEVALVVIVIQHVTVLQQLLPFVRLDGYYVVSDLVDVPDLFAYVKPVVTSAVSRKTPHPAVADLGRRARRIVTLWVAVTVPALAASLVLLAVHLPQWSATAAPSVTRELRQLDGAIDEGGFVAVLGSILETAALVLPLVGLILTLLLAVVRAARGFSPWARRRRQVDTPDRQVIPDNEREDPAMDETITRADLDLDARFAEARARIGQQADELLHTVAGAVEAARNELELARALRAQAEDEAEAILAAARRDAVELLTHTRNGVEVLLQDLSRRLGATATPTRNGWHRSWMAEREGFEPSRELNAP
jgi:putative peptide zinc metalloprotease protein